MKIKGRTIQGPNVVEVFIPRGNNEGIVFKLQAVLSFDHFDKLCKEPEPPIIKHSSGKKTPDLNDKNYKAQFEFYQKQRSNFIFIQSILATEDLIFDRIDINDPSTWHNLDDELKEAGLSQFERGKIFNAVLEANCLNEDKIEEARKRFLRLREEEANQLSSLLDEPKTTEFGIPANVLVSNHQA